MDFYDSAWELADLLETNKSVYLRLDPEVPDFTSDGLFKVVVWGQRTHWKFEAGRWNILELIGLFDHTIFDKEKVDRLYVWNIKSLASYFHFYSRKFFTPTTNIIDLKVIENFLGTRKNRPENLIEVVNRTKLAVKHKGWQSIYKSIHLPLSFRVLPAIETTPLLNDESKLPEYPYYEIEGQINGRMNCLKKFSKSYLPHNLGPDARKFLKPRGEHTRFIYADFRYCEVTVLQWLSKDPKLKEILDSGEDLHCRIYEILTHNHCDTEKKRKMSKLIFLPVMYGCGVAGLANVLSLSETVTKELIARIKSIFPVACEWMQVQQEQAKKGPVLDYFGRSRTFEPDKVYLARDFAVQAVAATACQEKLIALYKVLDREVVQLAFSVHDGFGFVLYKIKEARNVYRIIKDTMEAESALCPDLRMRVEVKFGARLESMKVLWSD